MSACKHGHNEYDTFTPCPACAAENEASAEEARRAEARAQLEKDRKERWARNAEMFRAIAAELGKDMAVVKVDEHGCPRLFIDGVDVSYEISFDVRRASSGRWSLGRVIGHRVVIGSYGSRKNFNQLKNGEYSYDKIAAELLSIATATKARDNRRWVEARNRDAVKALQAACGLSEYDSKFDASDDEKHPIKLNIRLGGHVSVARAQEIYDGLKKLGVI